MLGIALEGGGAKGAYEVGALKAIREMNRSIDAIAGTSVGSINAAFVAMDRLEALERIWLSTEMQDMIAGDAESLKRIMALDIKGDTDFQKLKTAVLTTLKQGGLDVTPFKTMLRTWVDEDMVRSSAIAYGLVSLSVPDFKPIEVFIEDIPQGALHDYILASSNFPAFKGDEDSDKKWVDGGFYDNLPINMLLDRGCDEVIAIRLMAMGRIRKVRNPERARITYILPSEDLGRTLEIDSSRAEINIQMGYYDALRVLKPLKGRYYYLSSGIETETLLQELVQTPPHILKRVARLFGEHTDPIRAIFERVIPSVSGALGLDDTADYETVGIAFYEQLAKLAAIPRYRVLSFSQLRAEVHAHYTHNAVSADALNSIAKLLVSTLSKTGFQLLPQAQKDQFIRHLYTVMISSTKKPEGVEGQATI